MKRPNQKADHTLLFAYRSAFIKHIHSCPVKLNMPVALYIIERVELLHMAHSSVSLCLPLQAISSMLCHFRFFSCS